MNQDHLIEIENLTNDEACALAGQGDEFIKSIEDYYHVSILARGNKVIISGSEQSTQDARDVFYRLLNLYRSKGDLWLNDVQYLLGGEQLATPEELDCLHDIIYTTSTKKKIRARTLGQSKYIEAIRNNDIVFGIGPAGTGKTFLAVVMAIKDLKSKNKERIVLVRPAVEAGESLGFLPGDLKEKIDPYLRPLYDALHYILGIDISSKLIERNVIEIAPLAYMRGRTLDNAFIILDEAQNTTQEQMKMFLTRIGLNSKAVVTGDLTQIDLPLGKKSGLIQCQRILQGIPNIDFSLLDETDVVRHPLVKRIIRAYEMESKKEL